MNRWGLFVEGQQEEGILPAPPGLGFGMSMFIPALGGHGDHPRDGAGNFPVGPRCSGVQIRMRRGGEEPFAGDDLVAVPRLWVCAPYAAAP